MKRLINKIHTPFYLKLEESIRQLFINPQDQAVVEDEIVDQTEQAKAAEDVDREEQSDSQA